MQQSRLEGCMVKQIENADLAKEAVIQLPTPKTSKPAALSTRVSRPSGLTPRRMNGGVAASRRSVTAVAGLEMCSVIPAQAPRSAPYQPTSNPRDGADIFQRVRDPDESVEKLWRAQFHDRCRPCVEGEHIDRTKVLHNMKKKQQQRDEGQSPLFLWGLPREHILDFIRQSVLPSSWANPVRRVVEWEAVPSEEDEAARLQRVISNALAQAPPVTANKPSSPRAPSPPRSPFKANGNLLSPRKDRRMSPRIQSAKVGTGPSSPRTPRMTPRSEERIHKFIAELRADPALWAVFQRDVEHIQQQYRITNFSSDKIRENKERARTPRSTEDYELRKKQADERMERTRRQRENLVQLEDERLIAKREAYLRRVNPTRQLPTAELELTVRYRRRKVWLHVVSFAAISHRWHQRFVQTKHLAIMARVKSNAASTIQRIWRKWKWKHASVHTVIVYSWLRKCLWKLLLRVRCRRKTRHAAIIQQFMLDHFSESHAARNFNRVMVQWRSKVIQAQQAAMSFIYCNRARLQTLSMWWDNVDHERQRMDRQLNSNIDDGRRSTLRKDSVSSSIGSTGSSGAPGSAGKHRSRTRSRTGSIAMLGGMDEKLASMQMLLTPIELQRLQQTSVQVVKIPKSIKMQLLTEFLTQSRKEFRRKQQTYKEMMLCASYAREVKLEEARAIVQSSVNWDGVADSTNKGISRRASLNHAVPPSPCFLLFSNTNGDNEMEALVRRGLQLTLDADPELRAFVVRQQEHRFQSLHQSPRRPSVSFSATAALQSTSVTVSPSPRYSILKKSTVGNLPLASLPSSVLPTTTLNSS